MQRHVSHTIILILKKYLCIPKNYLKQKLLLHSAPSNFQQGKDQETCQMSGSTPNLSVVSNIPSSIKLLTLLKEKIELV